jgi:hypothetical protein
MKNRIETGFGSEESPKMIKNLGVVVKEIIRDIKFYLKTSGIKTSLDLVEGIVPTGEDLDKRIISNLKGNYVEGKLVKLDDVESDLLLKKFEQKNNPLPEALREARIKNIEAYLKLRDLRKKELTDVQKNELDQILKRQVDVASLLKEPNLENHFDRLINYINSLIVSLKKEIDTLSEVKEEEIKEELALLNGLSGKHAFSDSDVREIKTTEHKNRIKEFNEQIFELENVLVVISKYINNKDKKVKEEEEAA